MLIVDLAVKLSVFGWFAYCRRHFTTGGKEPAGMTALKLTYLIGIVVNAWLLVARINQSDVYGFGLLFTLASFAIFQSAIRASKAAELHVAFSEATGTSLVDAGIYGHVRHPLYLSYIVYWFSWCVSLQFVLPSIAVFAVLLLLYGLAIRLEERELERTFGDEHREYKKRTSLLVPYLL